MAYDQQLAERISKMLQDEHIDFEEKKMFGGIAFMINDKMSVGVSKNELMLRVLEQNYDALLRKAFAKPMQFTGRTMKGFLFIEPEGLKTSKQLKYWVDYGVEFGKLGIVKSKQKKKGFSLGF